MMTILLLSGLGSGSFLQAQISQSLIYGEITLKDGTQYRGQIRWDNEEALWDDVFDAYKSERPTENLLTRAEARQDVFDYIEMFYNPTRKHVRNGMLSPIEFERRHQT